MTHETDHKPPETKPCQHCRGTGRVVDLHLETSPCRPDYCPICGGSGRISIFITIGPQTITAPATERDDDVRDFYLRRNA